MNDLIIESYIKEYIALKESQKLEKVVEDILYEIFSNNRNLNEGKILDKIKSIFKKVKRGYENLNLTNLEYVLILSIIGMSAGSANMKTAADRIGADNNNLKSAEKIISNNELRRNPFVEDYLRSIANDEDEEHEFGKLLKSLIKQGGDFEYSVGDHILSEDEFAAWGLYKSENPDGTIDEFMSKSKFNKIKLKNRAAQAKREKNNADFSEIKIKSASKYLPGNVEMIDFNTASLEEIEEFGEEFLENFDVDTWCKDIIKAENKTETRFAREFMNDIAFKLIDSSGDQGSHVKDKIHALQAGVGDANYIIDRYENDEISEERMLKNIERAGESAELYYDTWLELSEEKIN